MLALFSVGVAFLATFMVVGSTSAAAESRWRALDLGGTHPTILMEFGSSRWLERDPCNGQADGVNTVELARIVRGIQLDLCSERLEFKLRGETVEEFHLVREIYRQQEREKYEQSVEQYRAEEETKIRREEEQRDSRRQELIRESMQRQAELEAELEAENQRLAEQREAELQERQKAEERRRAERAAALPAPRTGGFYDQPLVLRPGIDDLFMSLGQFVSCLEHTLEYFAAQGSRPQHLSEVEVTSVRNEVTLFFYGVSGEYVYMQFTAYPGYVLLRSIETPDHIIFGYGPKWLIVSNWISACP